MKYYIPIILLMFIDKFLCDSPTYCQATFHLATCTNSMVKIIRKIYIIKIYNLFLLLIFLKKG